MNGFTGNPENLTITIISSFEVLVNWSESYISEETENTYIVEYKCDPKIMKTPIRKRVPGYSVNLTDLHPDLQYEVSVRNQDKGDPSVKSFTTPQFGKIIKIKPWHTFFSMTFTKDIQY